MQSSLIFDLDGTLVDSSRGILAALSFALNRMGLKARIPLDTSIIGPPLDAILRRVSGEDNPARIDLLAQLFQEEYDTASYLLTDAYPGIDFALRNLQSKDCVLFIATNKRKKPTLKIIDMFGWSELFAGIYTIDEHQSPNKEELVGRILSENLLSCASTCMIGDTPDDALAAKSNAINFLHAAWGYGLISSPALMTIKVLQHPEEIALLSNS